MKNVPHQNLIKSYMNNRGLQSASVFDDFNYQLASGGMPKTLKENSRENDNMLTLMAKKNLQAQSITVKNLLSRNGL